MITREFIKECLDILDLKYSELENGAIAISFSEGEAFGHPVMTFVDIKECRLSFYSRAIDYHPDGDLYAMANRHNCRAYSPACHIDLDGDVVMEQAFYLKHEVSPHYLLENVIRPSLFRPLQAFAAFELTDEEYERHFA